MTREEDPPAGLGREVSAKTSPLSANDRGSISASSRVKQGAHERHARRLAQLLAKPAELPPAEWVAPVSAFNGYIDNWNLHERDRSLPLPSVAAPWSKIRYEEPHPKYCVLYLKSDPKKRYSITFKRRWYAWHEGTSFLRNKIDLNNVRMIRVQIEHE